MNILISESSSFIDAVFSKEFKNIVVNSFSREQNIIQKMLKKNI